MGGQVHLVSWAMSVMWLVAVIIGVIVFGAIGLALWVAFKWLSHNRRVRLARKQAWRDRHRSDGTRLPPFGRGMCDRCGAAFEKVYYLPGGRRLCTDCFELEDVPAAPAEQAKEPS